MLSRHLYSPFGQRLVAPGIQPVRRASAPTARATGVPVAAGTDQASAKGENLRRTVIGTVEPAAQQQSSDLQAYLRS